MSVAPRILVVDDDHLVRETAMLLLREEFPEATVVPIAGAAALAEAIAKDQFDLVITDYQMGWSDGLAVLRQVKSRDPNCPVVMFTGTGSEEVAVEAMKSGLDDYVLKSPAHIKRLTASVRSVLQLAEQRKQLRENEARQHSLLNEVLDTSAVGLMILDARFHVVWLNAAMEEYFALRRDDVIGKDKRQLIQTRIKHCFEDPDGFAGKVLSAYERNGLELRFECHIVGADGRQDRWVEHRSLPIKSGLYAGGRIEHYYDVTDRKRMEMALSAAKDYATSLIETANAIFLRLDVKGTVLLINQAAEDITGYAKGELIGQNWFRRVVPRERFPHVWEAFQKLETGALPRNFENPILTKHGEERYIVWQNDEVREEGRVVGSVSFGIDITDHKRTEETLRVANETLAALIQASPMAITMLDRKGHVRVWNPAAERLFGWTADEIMGRPLPTVPADGVEEHRAVVQAILAGEIMANRELLRRRKDGAMVTISLFAAPLRNAANQITGVVGIMHDVTERKLMERHAARIERMAALGQLLSGIAHELKNPLFVLSGRLQLIREKLAAGQKEDLPQDLERVEEAAKRMARVTERFLTMAKPVPPRQTACAIPTLLEQTLEFMANELMKSRIEVSTDIQPGLPAVTADPRLLQEAFLNLMLNAMQAMLSAHQGGTLTVRARRQGDWVEVRIQDDGPGILPEHRGKLFEPFFSTKPAGEGTGLGLWTVRSVVEGLKGQVGYETETGRGTTFIVRLPVSEELNH